MPSVSASQINELVTGLGSQYTDKARVKADVKRLLGVSDGNWLTQLFTSSDAAKSKAWVLMPEVGFWNTCNHLKLVGYLMPSQNDASLRVHIVLWLPPEYPRGYPALLLVPAKHTRLVRDHPNVGPDGMFYHSYISTWDADHTLEELLAAVIAVLNQRPALEDTTLQDLTAGIVSAVVGFGSRVMEGARRATNTSTSSSGSSTSRPRPPSRTASHSPGQSSRPDEPWEIVNDPPQQPLPDTDTPATEPGTECSVCLENKKAAFFLPCGHVSCCMKCAKLLKECCICRSPIEKCYKAFV